MIYISFKLFVVVFFLISSIKKKMFILFYHIESKRKSRIVNHEGRKNEHHVCNSIPTIDKFEMVW